VHSGEAYSLALSEEDLAAQDAYEVQFRRGTQAYLRRDLAAAQEAFEVCLRLRPGDRRSLYNLERLKKRP
jgi:hypothetical protein